VAGPARVHLPAAARIGDLTPEGRVVVDRAMDVARERLGMTISWVAEFTEAEKLFRAVGGDTEEWQLHDGDAWPVSESYCRRMVDGQLPNAISDTAAEPLVADLDVTREKRIVAYIGVPLVLPEGELCGAFCCASHEVAPLDDRDVRFMQVLARLVADEIALQVLREREAAARALAAALDVRDHYTGEHAHHVVRLAGAVARRLGLDEQQCRAVETVALLHDVGKVLVPDAILQKPGALDDAEWAVMRRHPDFGAKILERVEVLRPLAAAVAAEHEHWNGGGYPSGLADGAIPVEARIVLVCDAFHAMTSDRPYRGAMAHDDAVAELRRCRGTMFWPDAVDALLAELAR
jgi:putative nucleotidyltransferase with HDIG domain